MKAHKKQLGLIVFLLILVWSAASFAQSNSSTDPAHESKPAAPSSTGGTATPKASGPLGAKLGANPSTPAPKPMNPFSGSSTHAPTAPDSPATPPAVTPVSPFSGPSAPGESPAPAATPRTKPISPFSGSTDTAAPPVKPDPVQPTVTPATEGPMPEPQRSPARASDAGTVQGNPSGADKPASSAEQPAKPGRKNTQPSKSKSGRTESSAPKGPDATRPAKSGLTPAPPVDTLLSTYTVSKTAPDLDWMESLTGEVVSVNAAAQRMLVRDERTHRTKLINFNADTVFKKADERVQPNSLRLGTHLTVKYDFLDSTARLVTVNGNLPATTK